MTDSEKYLQQVEEWKKKYRLKECPPGGWHCHITRMACKTGDWSEVEKFPAYSLINVLEFFNLTPERRKWVNDLLKKKMPSPA